MKPQCRDKRSAQQQSQRGTKSIARMLPMPSFYLATILFSFFFIFCINQLVSPATQNLTSHAAVNGTRHTAVRKSIFDWTSTTLETINSNYSVNATGYKMLNVSEGPQVAVYYSPWCHHCRHYVPLFIELADKYLAEVTNTTGVKGSRPNGHVTFSTISCATERNICFTENINAYPTVIAKHFPKDIKSMDAKGVALSNIGGIDTLKKYLAKNNPVSSGLSLVGFNYTTNKKILSKDMNNANVFIDGSMERFLHMKKHSEAITATPDLKLDDALASLNYLMVEETAMGFDENKRDALIRLLSLTVRLLPTERMSSIDGYRKIILLLKNTSTEIPDIPVENYLDREHLSPKKKPHVPLTPNRIKSTKLLLQAMRTIIYGINSTSVLTNDHLWWRQCNVMSKNTKLRNIEERALSNSESRGLRSRASKSSQIMFDIGEKEVAGSGVAATGPDTGYTCGLWLLLHYFTVAGGQQSVSSVHGTGLWITTSVIMSVMKSFVSDLFGCEDCRTHFLKSFDSCEYNRCKMNPHDFPELQYWLFQLHNDVTLRVFETKSNGYQDDAEVSLENVGNGNSTFVMRMKALRYGIYYPPQAACPTCTLPHANTSSTHSDVDSSSVERGKQGMKNPSLRINHYTESKPDAAEFNREHTAQYLISSYWKPTWVLQTGK